MAAPNIPAEVAARAARVRLMIFDVDGVLTDGSLTYGAEGEQVKTFNVHDGLGIKLLQEAGIKTAIISARRTPIVLARAKDLGIEYVHQGGYVSETFETMQEAKAWERVMEGKVTGDDVVDLPILTRVGFAVSVPNGRPEVQQRAHHVTSAAGGRGAVREVCELLLHAQDSYQRVMAQFLV